MVHEQLLTCPYYSRILLGGACLFRGGGGVAANIPPQSPPPSKLYIHVHTCWLFSNHSLMVVLGYGGELMAWGRKSLQLWKLQEYDFNTECKGYCAILIVIRSLAMEVTVLTSNTLMRVSMGTVMTSFCNHMTPSSQVTIQYMTSSARGWISPFTDYLLGSSRDLRSVTALRHRQVWVWARLLIFIEVQNQWL